MLRKDGGNMSTWKNLVGRWGSGAGETDDIRIDASTNSLQTIDYAHHEVHAGSAYFYKSAHAIAKAATVDHLIITTDTTAWSHMVFHVEGLSSTITVQIYEDTETSATGTLEDSFNRNRNVANDNTTEIYEAPTVTGVGTLLVEWDLGAGKNSDGGMKRDAVELVLKQESQYLLRVTEDNTAATTVNIGFDWYEHQDKH